MTQANSPVDWLDESANEAEQAKAKQQYDNVARLYLVFETHPIAKQLLAMWTASCLHKRTPVNAPHTQYAADEAVRDFVAGIHRQIEKAHQVPTTST